MNPDFVSVRAEATVSEALAALRRSELGASQLLTVCVVAEDRRLVGAVALPRLVRAPTDVTVASLIDESVPTVSPETDLPDVACLMTDFNLIALPVVDAEERPIGMIAVDDVLELLVPEEWRRRAGIARE